MRVHGDAAQEVIDDVFDSVSQSIGEFPLYCGTRTYELIDPTGALEKFLTFTDLKLIVKSSDDADIGVYPAQVKVSLTEYPDIFQEADFNVFVSPCQPVDFSITSGP